MFASIAPNYDLLNHVLSLNTDKLWRAWVAREASRGLAVERILDVACGTGDMAFELRRLHPTATIIGADFTRPMLDIAARKSPGRASARRAFTWVEADGLRLPFADASFDLLTIAFGLRNMESLEQGLHEMRRVLRPGGRLAVLEFTTPETPFIRTWFLPYFLGVLPRVAGMVSRQSAYTYLGESVMAFPTRRKLARVMMACGFGPVKHAPLHFGVAALHLATRKV